jgi:hypothetical protein
MMRPRTRGRIDFRAAIVPCADYDEAARVKRYDVARDSGMMPPTVTE